jgi:colicin import membrane protein
MTFRLRHLLAALVLHAALFGLLVGGAQCSSKPVRPPVIRAVLLNPDRKELADQKKRDEQREAERKRREEAEKKKQAEDKRKLAEEEKRREQEAERQKQVAIDKQKKDDAARKQKELADRKKADELARKKKEQEQHREQQEDAQREVQERARMEEEMRQEAMRRNIAREQQQREATERERKSAEWADVLGHHIQKYWIRPATAAADFECTVHVQLLPDGSVTFAKIDKSCGSSQLDKSVEDAVYRSSPLPRPADPSVFDRDLVIIFTPH